MRRTWRFLTNCGMRSSICDFSSSDTIQGGTCSSLSHLVSPSPLPLPAPPVVSFPAASSTALLMQAHQIGTVLEKLSGNFFPFLVESSSTHLAQRIHYTKREREREKEAKRASSMVRIRQQMEERMDGGDPHPSNFATASNRCQFSLFRLRFQLFV